MRPLNTWSMFAFAQTNVSGGCSSPWGDPGQLARKNVRAHGQSVTSVRPDRQIGERGLRDRQVEAAAVPQASRLRKRTRRGEGCLVEPLFKRKRLLRYGLAKQPLQGSLAH